MNARARPLCVDLCCGAGGWADGFLAAGYRVVGFDIRRLKRYPYPGDLVLQDVRTLDGRQFRGAAVIVASPPCHEFSRLAPIFNRGYPPPALGVELFRACQRIIREAGVPGIVENVHLAQRWVGPAEAHFGSFYLWGDVPLLRPRMKFVKGAFSGHYRSRNLHYRRAGHPGYRRSAILRARIPFDLAHWLALAYLHVGDPIP